MVQMFDGYICGRHGHIWQLARTIWALRQTTEHERCVRPRPDMGHMASVTGWRREEWLANTARPLLAMLLGIAASTLATRERLVPAMTTARTVHCGLHCHQTQCCTGTPVDGHAETYHGWTAWDCGTIRGTVAATKHTGTATTPFGLEHRDCSSKGRNNTSAANCYRERIVAQLETRNHHRETRVHTHQSAHQEDERCNTSHHHAISDVTHNVETTRGDHRHRDAPSALSHHHETQTAGPGRVAHRGGHIARTSRVTVAVGGVVHFTRVMHVTSMIILKTVPGRTQTMKEWAC